MKINVKALKDFSSINAGNFSCGEERPIDDWLAKQLQNAGLVEILGKPRQTKVIPNDFTSGPGENGSSSQVAPASQKEIAKESKSGEKKTRKKEQ